MFNPDRCRFPTARYPINGETGPCLETRRVTSDGIVHLYCDHHAQVMKEILECGLMIQPPAASGPDATSRPD